MKNVPETLPTDVTALQEMVVALRAQNDDLTTKYQRLSVSDQYSTSVFLPGSPAKFHH